MTTQFIECKKFVFKAKKRGIKYKEISFKLQYDLLHEQMTKICD